MGRFFRNSSLIATLGLYCTLCLAAIRRRFSSTALLLYVLVSSIGK